MIDVVKNHLRTFIREKKYHNFLFKLPVSQELSNNEFYRFSCNICSKVSIAPLPEVKYREGASCYHCGSNSRYRSIVASLSEEIFGEIIPLPDFRKSKSIVGIGMSDSPIYAKPLSKKFLYKNTFYHKEPKLDIMSLSKEMYDKADFIISSEIFEHVPPPVDLAFDNLFKILKKGGVCIFSVPYNNQGTTQEHFPELFEYKIVTRNENQVLINKTREDIEQSFENLCFHGGPGATLEMRKFSKTSLLDHIAKAGFTKIKLHDNSIPEYGILLDEDADSLVISMYKP
jgi:SAM-dependent methyltransferase